uniref:Ras association domain-containing protein n=1 Tax=Strigamia maritima TaxID=126957 RepID=T1ILF3_STRMM
MSTTAERTTHHRRLRFVMDGGFSASPKQKSNRPLVFMIPIILKVHADANSITEVPVTPETTCRDVLECCREPGDDDSHLVELWRGCERLVCDEEKPLELLKEWGIHWEEVKFFLRYQSTTNPSRSQTPSSGDFIQQHPNDSLRNQHENRYLGINTNIRG